MINGAHSHSAIRGSFSIDNGDGSQNVTFKIRVHNWFFGSKNQDFFHAFSQNNIFFFRDSRLSKLVIDRDLKNNRNKMLLSWFKLRHKNKNKFHFISIYQSLVFFQVWKVAGQISRDFFKNWRLCANPENEVAFFQLRCIYFFLTKCRIFVNFPGVDFLE